MTERTGRPGARPVPARGRQLAACVFCGDTEMSQEHLIADWATRAFTRSRRPPLLAAVLTRDHGPTRLTSLSPHVLTAGVTCRSCNNGWIATLDREASHFAKPLIRGDAPVTLGPAHQTVLAAWLVKTAVVCDAAESGESGPLASGIARPFMAARQPSPTHGLFVHVIRPETPGLFVFGTRVLSGSASITVTVRTDGAEDDAHTTTTTVPVPAYQIMVGALTGFMTGPYPPLLVSDYLPVWPVTSEDVLVEPHGTDTLPNLGGTDHHQRR